MEKVTLERSWSDPIVLAQVEAAARRERAKVLKRFFEQAAQALLAKRAEAPRAQPCEAC